MRKKLLFCMLVCACQAFGQAPASGSSAGVIGDLRSPGATVRGSVMVTGLETSVMSGSQIVAGEGNAQIGLKRGGEINVCKRSSVTLTSASNGREMLVALNSGALEVKYSLSSTSDTIMTPDFRLSLTGPGAFHFAVGTAANGGMCLRSLAGNASSIIVNEQFGDGAHQVKPDEQFTFHNGKVDGPSAGAADCGCPAPQVEAPAQPQKQGSLGFPEEQSLKAQEAVAAGQEPPKGEELPIPASQAPRPGQEVTQVDAPMVFRAEDVPPPAPQVKLAKLPAWPIAMLQPKAEPPKPVKKPWYQRFGKALASFFNGNS